MNFNRTTPIRIVLGTDQPAASRRRGLKPVSIVGSSAMLTGRNPRYDLFAIVLMAALVFLTFSLVTYDRADAIGPYAPPLDQILRSDSLVYPANQKIYNACGYWGALAADVLITALGVGAYFILIGIGTTVISLLGRQSLHGIWARGAGWVLTLVGITALASLVLPRWSPGPVIGAGGYLGRLVQGLLQMHFAHTGTIILATSILIAGLLLWTDYLLVKATRAVLAPLFEGLSYLLPFHRRQQGGKDRLRRDDLNDMGDEEVDHIVIRSGQQSELHPRDRSGKLDGEEDEPDLESLADDADEAQAADDEADWEDEQQDQQLETIPFVVKTAASTTATRTRTDKTKPARSRFGIGRKPKSDRDKVIQRLNDAAAVESPGDYRLPEVELLAVADNVSFQDRRREAIRNGRIIERTFAEFGFQVKVVAVETGPVIAQYEIQLEAGLRLSKITGLADDLAIALRVPTVRIVAPIPGKNTVGIEVPNSTRQVVRLREVMEQAADVKDKMKIPLFLGKDVSGDPLAIDLATLPHLLIAGRTGTGKSVCLNAIISSILMTRRPDEVRMLMIDPKMVELSGYGRLPHLMHPVVTDMRKAEAILAWAVEKMEERYRLLARAGVRHISSYNQLGEEELLERLQPESSEERRSIPHNLPFIVIIADEMADLMMTAGKEVEQHIIRLAQKSRAVGIHLILATQKPTVDVITGLIKSNLPARIAFQVASRVDSRVVLDEMGADKLLGNGDMLFLWPGTSTLIRGQGTYLSDSEIEKLTDAVSTGEQNFVHELVNLKVGDAPGNADGGRLQNRDELYASAVEAVIREQRGSVSLLQRVLGIGYGRAARLIDYMEEDGIVGPYAGSKSREIIMSLEGWRRLLAEDNNAASAAGSDGARRELTDADEGSDHGEDRPYSGARSEIDDEDQLWDSDDEPDRDEEDHDEPRDDEDSGYEDEEDDGQEDEMDYQDDDSEYEEDEYDDEDEEDDEEPYE